ncbi:hypothetical protein [Chamaesiphon sp. OTE_75_metabat_556]|uniref:hypothetical protein n=1 Tax=Chamaesiphon sp. OTE_75_metabat_556 TaxID=2964692 RepID=UPI00286C65DD|nr:hypothetical protein [Chamaesiphon sp. OTE_75_metabat_556]
MSNLSKSKLGKFAVTIFALSSISAILTTAQKAEAFPTNTIMQPGSSITSNNQCFSLNAQTDGNLVLYRRSNGQALWHTGTYGKNVKQTIFQTDGNLVIYDTSNSPVWASNTERRGAAQIYVQDDGNVVMYNSQNQALWHTNTVTSCGNSTPTPARPTNPLINNMIMQPGSSITSNNQCFSLNAQTDGNLVLYRKSNGQALWHTGTYGKNVKQTIFQNDGNLVIYNTSNGPVWASNTERRGATKLTVQDDGNIVMYNAQNQALWSSNTVNSCNAPTSQPVSNPDIKINLYFQNGSFTTAQQNSILKAAQNWENIITRDSVSSGVLNINVVAGEMRQPGNHWAETDFPNSPQPRQRFLLSSPYHTTITIRRSFLNGSESYQLTKLATHEIGHALYLDEAYFDKSLGTNGIMNVYPLYPVVTEGIYKKLESLGYSVNRNPSLQW